MMACIYRNGEKICIFSSHKHYATAKSKEATEKKLKEEEI